MNSKAGRASSSPQTGGPVDGVNAASGGRRRPVPSGLRARGSNAAAVVDDLLPGSPFFRKRMVAYVSGAVLLLAAISVVLAWRQYDDAKSQAVNDLDARVVAVSALVDTAFAGKVATLDVIAKTPAVVDQKPAAMAAYFKSVDPAGSSLFSGGLGWSDRQGWVLATTSSRAPDQHRLTTVFPPRADLGSALRQRRPDRATPEAAARRCRRSDLRSPAPALGGPRRQHPVTDGNGHKQALDLGFGNLQIIDRNGRLLTSASSALERAVAPRDPEHGLGCRRLHPRARRPGRRRGRLCRPPRLRIG